MYLILGSLFGNGPTPLGGGVILPLTIDPFTELVLALTGSQAAFVGFLGALDAQGSASAQIVAGPGQIPPEALLFFPGMHFAWITVLPQIDFASNAVFVAFEF
ncbi:MAG: hypothetical protein IPN34_13050 [Planctomycetes bacterium]|nr:hypothetical protein [Planctomycetota bacterium]